MNSDESGTFLPVSQPSSTNGSETAATPGMVQVFGRHRGHGHRGVKHSKEKAMRKSQEELKERLKGEGYLPLR